MARLFAGTPFDIPPKCDDCGKFESDCTCTPTEKAAAEAQRRQAAARLPPSSQTAVIRMEKRKGGRTATVVAGLTHAANDLPALLKKLQADCGSGGTVKAKEDLLEIQGNHAQRVQESLLALGYRVKTK
ncbi:MAG: translation initiation factor [Blastopirellula sp. JB062]